MPYAVPTRVSAVFLLSVGFLAGVLAAIGCGGAGGTIAFAGSGSTTTVHAKSLAGPVTWMDDFTFSVDYTPTDANATIIAVQVTGQVETTMTQVLLRLNTQLPLTGFSQLGNQITITATTTVGLSAPYDHAGGSTFPAPSYHFFVFLDAVTDGVPVTVNSLTIRIITTEGVMVMNPSPELS